MDLTSLAVFAGILMVAAGTPGPNIGALVARVISRGHKGVFPFMLGLWIGDAVWLSLAVWGFRRWRRTSILFSLCSNMVVLSIWPISHGKCGLHRSAISSTRKSFRVAMKRVGFS